MTEYDQRHLGIPASDPTREASLFLATKLRAEAPLFPLASVIVGTSSDPDHYRLIDISREVVIPLPPHPGAFGVVRKFHTHEGVDLYCNEGAPVRALESGRIVAIENFTGPAAGSPWWLDTKSVLVEGEAGVVCYGEISPESSLAVGDMVRRGQFLGAVTQVLAKDKGRPRSMLHVELHIAGTTSTKEWRNGEPRPVSLRDPTELLIEAARHAVGSSR